MFNYHIDRCPNGQNESRDLRVYSVLLLEAVHGDGERGGAGGGAPGRGKGAEHVLDELERETFGEDRVDERQHDEAVDGEAEQDHHEVPGQLLELRRQVALLQQLAGDKEADAEGREVDDPRGDLHHHHAQAVEEL